MAPSWKSPEVTLLDAVGGKDLRFAVQLGLKLATARDPSSWQIVCGDGSWALCGPGPQGPLRLELDLTQGPLARRLATARRSDPLARAVGLWRRATPPTVLDATAGLCRDAMILAALGCRVTAIERVPALLVLAQSAARQADFLDRLSFVHADAVEHLQALAATAAPDVVYLDPMFDEGKRAQVKKDMQVCRLLAGPPEDVAALFAAARAVARERVVVKRHKQLPPLATDVAFSVRSERLRYDVHLTSNAPAGQG